MTQHFDVGILGGGIAGLTTAHELKRRGFRGTILILERNNEIGGQARSGVINQVYWNEYSWRVYGPAYYTLRRIMREISTNNNATVYDNLVDIRNNILALPQDRNITLNYGTSAFSSYLKEFSDVSWQDKLRLINRACGLLIMSEARIRGEMSERKWQDFIPNVPKFQTFLVKSMAPYLGIDYREVSVGAVWDVAEGAARGGGNLSVFNGPTSKVFFDPWQKHLESQGVIIKVNSNASQLTMNNGLHVLATNNTSYSCKWLVSALPVEEAARLIPTSELKELSQLSRQWMVSVQFYFTQEILKPEAATAIHLPESPWQLIIEPQGLIWDKKWIPDTTNPSVGSATPALNFNAGVKDIWSIGICDDQTPGLLIKKGARYCTQEEMFKEVWHQICQISLPSYRPLSQIPPSSAYLWYSYQWQSERKETLTWEPKFSPNVGTWKLRPETNKFLDKRIVMVGVYTKNPEEIVTMDAAAQSGVRAAVSILQEEQKENSKARPYFLQNTEPIINRPWSWLLAPLRTMDVVLYDIGLPSLPGLPSLILYLILLIVIVYYVFRLFI